MKSHAQALQSFARRLSLLLVFRGAVRWVTLWFFIWGVLVLAGRIGGLRGVDWLELGLLGTIPFVLAATIRELHRRAAFARVRAAYDGLNRCGGLIMAEEAAEMSAWQDRLPSPASPALRWRGGRSLWLFAVSVLFFIITLCLPDRLTTFAARRPLEIGKLVEELRAEIETLEQEKILEENKADDLQKQLARLKEQSSAVDPHKTWEALDHIKESNSELARQAAEEALSKTASLTEAETLASALQTAEEAGVGQDTATRAAQDLAAMLKATKLEEGLLKGEMPPDLLSQLDGLSKEDLERLLGAIQFNKSCLGRTMTNLAKCRLIDARLLAQCRNAGMCPNPDALAAFLCENTNTCNFALLVGCPGRGGVTRGRADAPMTWKDESSDQDAKFKEKTLASSSRLSDAQFVGVSRAAPELSDENVTAEHGALASARAGGGSANAQVILPRHRQAVQQFFKREE